MLEKAKVITAVDIENKDAFGGPLDTPLKLTSPKF